MKEKKVRLALFIALVSMVTLLSSCFRPRVIVVESGPGYRPAPRPYSYYRPYNYGRSYGRHQQHRYHSHRHRH